MQQAINTKRGPRGAAIREDMSYVFVCVLPSTCSNRNLFLANVFDFGFMCEKSHKPSRDPPSDRQTHCPLNVFYDCRSTINQSQLRIVILGVASAATLLQIVPSFIFRSAKLPKNCRNLHRCWQL